MDQDRTPTGPKEPRPSNAYLAYGGFALQLLGAMGLAGWVGHRLDVYFALGFPVFLLSFVLAVFAGMLYQANRRLNK